jgi:hypothetical protein
MVLYKNEKSTLFSSWCSMGPDGTTYLSCESGWFGMAQFNRWFVDVSINNSTSKGSYGTGTLL